MRQQTEQTVRIYDQLVDVMADQLGLKTGNVKNRRGVERLLRQTTKGLHPSVTARAAAEIVHESNSEKRISIAYNAIKKVFG